MYFQAFVQPPNAGLTKRGNGPCVLWWGDSNRSALRRVWHRRFFRESSWLGNATEDVHGDYRQPTAQKMTDMGIIGLCVLDNIEPLD
jgi:hypothetical protein